VTEAYVPDNWRWRDVSVRAADAVVFDIDGVLSDAASRQHYIDGPGYRDWDAFFDACGDDPLIEEVASLLHLLDGSLQVILLTGRPIRVQTETVAWLKRYELRWDLLIMRDFGDYSAAREFKRWTVSDLRRYGFNLRLAFEDDRRNLEMFRAEGIPCVYIHSGYFDR
jgi:phosphoglycolate phosphatase-like HAD superfamily hydrolase